MVLNASKIDPQLIKVREYHRMGAFIMQHVMADPVAHVRGVSVILDCQGTSLSKLLGLFSLEDMKRGTAMWRGAYPCKLKTIYVVHLHGFLYFTSRLLYSVLTAKLRERVVFVGDDYEAMISDVGIHNLPMTLGGSNADFNWEQRVLRRSF